MLKKKSKYKNKNKRRAPSTAIAMLSLVDRDGEKEQHFIHVENSTWLNHINVVNGTVLIFNPTHNIVQFLFF